MQGACDHKHRFVHKVTKSPGGASDCNAHGRSDLANQVEELSKRRHIARDNACMPIVHSLTPFNAVETETVHQKNVANDACSIAA